MSFTDILFFAAPFIPVLLFILGILDFKSMIITCLSFFACFIVFLWEDSFLAVWAGAAVFSVIRLLMLITQEINNKQIKEKYAIVSSVDGESINVLYNGVSYNAFCVNKAVACGDVVKIEWEKNGVLFVIKN